MTEKKLNELDNSQGTNEKLEKESSEKKTGEDSEHDKQVENNTTPEIEKRRFRPLKRLKKIK